MNSTAKDTGKKKCPMCKKAVEHEFRPFCSARCKTLDLGKWFGESYRISGDEEYEKAELSSDDQ